MFPSIWNKKYLTHGLEVKSQDYYICLGTPYARCSHAPFWVNIHNCVPGLRFALQILRCSSNNNSLSVLGTEYTIISTAKYPSRSPISSRSDKLQRAGTDTTTSSNRSWNIVDERATNFSTLASIHSSFRREKRGGRFGEILGFDRIKKSFPQRLLLVPGNRSSDGQLRRKPRVGRVISI